MVKRLLTEALRLPVGALWHPAVLLGAEIPAAIPAISYGDGTGGGCWKKVLVVVAAGAWRGPPHGMCVLFPPQDRRTG